jgi:DNA modification methylase
MKPGASLEKMSVAYVPISELKPFEGNPRKWSEETIRQMKQSLKAYGMTVTILVNSALGREGIVIGGNLRVKVAKEMGYTELPVVYRNISDPMVEKDLALRLNKAVGEWDWDLLAQFDEALLVDVGFSSEELDKIFDEDVDNPEQFDLNKELKKLEIAEIEIQKGDVWQLGDSRLMCGDSTVDGDMLRLMSGELADMCFTDPPYILDYLHGKKKTGGEAVTGFGAKRNRRYLETDVLPDNFTELWMGNVNKVAKEHFSIIVYENWKNLRIIWGEMEKYWKIKNMIVWHLENRHQGYAGKHKFFSKHDIAMVGASKTMDIEFNHEKEKDGLQEEYETALFAIRGKPQWENYQKGGKYCPTDFIEYRASDEKSSGQGVIFGTKPVEILIPYIKVLTRRGDLILEPFGGSGSTLIAAEKMKRRCYVMEKSPVYAEVIRKRWENLAGKKAKKLGGFDAVQEQS